MISIKLNKRQPFFCVHCHLSSFKYQYKNNFPSSFSNIYLASIIRLLKNELFLFHTGDGVSLTLQPTTYRTSVTLFVCSNSTVGIIWPHKTHHYNKAEITSEEQWPKSMKKKKKKKTRLRKKVTEPTIWLSGLVMHLKYIQNCVLRYRWQIHEQGCLADDTARVQHVWIKWVS